MTVDWSQLGLAAILAFGLQQIIGRATITHWLRWIIIGTATTFIGAAVEVVVVGYFLRRPFHELSDQANWGAALTRGTMKFLACPLCFGFWLGIALHWYGVVGLPHFAAQGISVGAIALVLDGIVGASDSS